MNGKQHWEWEANRAWLPEIERLGILLLNDHRQHTGNHALRMRLSYNSATDVFRPSEYHPPLSETAIKLVGEMRAHHKNVMGTDRLTVEFSDSIPTYAGRTVVVSRTALTGPMSSPMSSPTSSPTPNPPPPPTDNFPPACIPCIPYVVFV